MAIGALRPIEWLAPDQAALFDSSPARLTGQHSPDREFRLARMPFVITAYENGLQVADLEFASSGRPLHLQDWMDQHITLYPSEISLRETIRSIADKGGGSHVDDKVNRDLHEMSSA